MYPNILLPSLVKIVDSVVARCYILFMETTHRFEIAITPDTTIDTIRQGLPLGGDYGLVRNEHEWLLWVEIDVDGLATLDDFNTSIDIDPDENLYAIAQKWVRDVS